MPEWQAREIEGTAAEKAVGYILQRVVHDSNFRHYMLHTQALELCLHAEAIRIGADMDYLEQRLHKQVEDKLPWLKKHNADVPEVVRLQEQVGELEAGTKLDDSVRENTGDAERYAIQLSKAREWFERLRMTQTRMMASEDDLDELERILEPRAVAR